MTESGHPGRTTVLVGLLLALLLVGAYVLVTCTDGSTAPLPTPERVSAPTTSSTPTSPRASPPPATPRPGADYPVRRSGALEEDRSVLLNGRGDADLRYRRAPHNGTRLHFICTGCDADSWLVELPRGVPVGDGPLPDPADVTSAIDTVAPGATSSLLVKAPAQARWTVTLTPFDAVPVHEQTFDALGDDVVAVRAQADLQLTCAGASSVRTLARKAGAQQYAVVQVRRAGAAGTWPLTAPLGSDLMVVVVSCPGRWTVTVP
ncbi:MAG: hypothetical protein ACRYG2_34135 [Janthinobacterium lividum]